MLTLEQAMDVMAQVKSEAHAEDLKFYNTLRISRLNDVMTCKEDLRSAKKALRDWGNSRQLRLHLELDHDE